MIVDRLDNAEIYAPLARQLSLAVQLLREGTMAEQPDGRYEIDGQDLFCLVQRYESQSSIPTTHTWRDVRWDHPARYTRLW